MKKIDELKHLKKLLTFALVGSMTFGVTSCNKTEEVTKQSITTQTTTEELAGPSEPIEETNETIDEIIKEYNKKTNNNLDLSDIFIEEFDKPIYIWNNKGENYIYDYGFNKSDNPEYTNSDPGYHSEMYAVIIKNNDDSFEPISALAYIDNKIVNVKVTYYYNKTDYKPSENYIIINNPTKEDLNNLKHGDEYIKSENNNKLILSKNN